jgi:hypothetical protein
VSWLAVGLLAALAIAALAALVYENGRWRRAFIAQARDYALERRDLLTRLQAPHMASALAPTAEDWQIPGQWPPDGGPSVEEVDAEHIASGRGDIPFDPDTAMLFDPRLGG